MKHKFNYKKSLALLVSVIFIFVLPLFLLHAQYGGGAQTTIDNPLGANNTSVQAILLKLMNLVTTVGSIVVVFFIIYSGYTLVISRGNPDGLKKAKEMFYATVIGGAVLLGADIIANAVVTTVNTTVGR